MGVVGVCEVIHAAVEQDEWTYCFAWFLSWAEMGLAMVYVWRSAGRKERCCVGCTCADGEGSEFDGGHGENEEENKQDV
jgi:hypothetical protein